MPGDAVSKNASSPPKKEKAMGSIHLGDHNPLRESHKAISILKAEKSHKEETCLLCWPFPWSPLHPKEAV